MRSSKIEEARVRKFVYDPEQNRFRSLLYLVGQTEIPIDVQGNRQKVPLVCGKTHVDTAEGYILSPELEEALHRVAEIIEEDVGKIIFEEEPYGVVGSTVDGQDSGGQGLNYPDNWQGDK